MFLDGASAKAAGGLQRMFETHRSVPPVQHHHGVGQRRALQPPQPGIAVTQHRRRRVYVNSRRGKHMLERIGGSHWAVADEGKAMLRPLIINHLARDHFEMAPLPAMPAADVAAIKPDYDRFGWLRRVGESRLPHNDLADPPRPVAHVLACCAPLIGSNSDKRPATLPNGANAA